MEVREQPAVEEPSEAPSVPEAAPSAAEVMPHPAPPEALDGAAVFLAGQTLGRIEHKVDQALEQNARVEAQQIQILEQHNSFDAVVSRVATELVDVRARVTKLESTPPPAAPPVPALPPMRAQLPSVNTEMRTELKNTHDSLRAVALKQDDFGKKQAALDTKQDEQMAILTSLAKTLDVISKFFTPKVVLTIFALGVLLAGMISGWVQKLQPAPPPVVVTAPALAPAPVAPVAPRATP